MLAGVVGKPAAAGTDQQQQRDGEQRVPWPALAGPGGRCGRFGHGSAAPARGIAAPGRPGPAAERP